MNGTAIVTGSSYGLGKAICEKLLADGYKVYGISRSENSIHHPLFNWIKADLLNPVDIDSLNNKIPDKTIDLLVNNAGMTIEKKALEFNDQNFNKLFGLNFIAPIKLTSLFIPKMTGKLVVNISSNSDRWPDPLWAMYGSTKAALNLYFDTIAVEYPDIKIISLLPSFINTPLLRKCYVEDGFDIKKSMASEEVADFLVSIAGKPQIFCSGSRIIVVNNSLKSVCDNPEKLLVYNVETKRLEKIRWQETIVERQNF